MSRYGREHREPTQDGEMVEGEVQRVWDCETKTGRGWAAVTVLTVLDSGVRGGQDDDHRFHPMKTFGLHPR